MKRFDFPDLDVQSSDYGTIQITLLRASLNNPTVASLRKDRHGHKTVEMVGLLHYLTMHFGSFYSEKLLDALFHSMASYDLLDEKEHLLKLRERFEKLYNEYGEDLVETYLQPGAREVSA